MRYVPVALGISSTLLVQLVAGMGQMVKLEVCIQQALHACLCLPHLSQEVTTLGSLPGVRLMLPRATSDIVQSLPQHLWVGGGVQKDAISASAPDNSDSTRPVPNIREAPFWAFCHNPPAVSQSMALQQ